MSTSDTQTFLPPKKRKIEEGEPSMSSAADVSAMLALWTQEQLTNVLAQLGSQSPDVLAAIIEENDKDPKQRKLFVRNLSFETDDASLHRVFSTYGSVQEAVVIKNKMTQQSKGFGFVTFDTSVAAQAAIAPGSVEIDGRTAFVSLAAKRGGPPHGQAGSSALTDPESAQTKLFVRQLDYKTTSETMARAFAQYGPIKEAVVLENKATGQSKGYGFVTFETAQGAQAALADGGTKQIDGRTTYCKLAADGHLSNERSNPQRYGGGGNMNQMNMYQMNAQRMRQMGGQQFQMNQPQGQGYGQGYGQQGYGQNQQFGQNQQGGQNPPPQYSMWPQQY